MASLPGVLAASQWLPSKLSKVRKCKAEDAVAECLLNTEFLSKACMNETSQCEHEAFGEDAWDIHGKDQVRVRACPLSQCEVL